MAGQPPRADLADPPHSPDWEAHVLPVSITKAQVEASPDIDTAQPVSRQHEMQYLGYYGYPMYWGGENMWGDALYPYAMLPSSATPVGAAGLVEGAAERSGLRELDAAAHAAAERQRERNKTRTCAAARH